MGVLVKGEDISVYIYIYMSEVGVWVLINLYGLLRGE